MTFLGSLSTAATMPSRLRLMSSVQDVHTQRDEATFTSITLPTPSTGPQKYKWSLTRIHCIPLKISKDKPSREFVLKKKTWWDFKWRQKFTRSCTSNVFYNSLINYLLLNNNYFVSVWSKPQTELIVCFNTLYELLFSFLSVILFTYNFLFFNEMKVIYYLLYRIIGRIKGILT